MKHNLAHHVDGLQARLRRVRSSVPGEVCRTMQVIAAGTETQVREHYAPGDISEGVYAESTGDSRGFTLGTRGECNAAAREIRLDSADTERSGERGSYFIRRGMAWALRHTAAHLRRMHQRIWGER